ncbi:MAG: hypothetical protein U5K55_11465 [Aliarcobacter sp.]|nr:hypothetical protein [Aliarcobacter sp.]
MPISTVRSYLAKWQFTSKKPIKEHMREKIVLRKVWLEETYPQIKLTGENAMACFVSPPPKSVNVINQSVQGKSNTKMF